MSHLPADIHRRLDPPAQPRVDWSKAPEWATSWFWHPSWAWWQGDPSKMNVTPMGSAVEQFALVPPRMAKAPCFGWAGPATCVLRAEAASV